MSYIHPRKRATRACDRCSEARTRCDGQYPCHRCQEYGHPCLYNRDVKKRGRKRASNKEIPGLEKRHSNTSSFLLGDSNPSPSISGQRDFSHIRTLAADPSPNTPSHRLEQTSPVNYFSSVPTATAPAQSSTPGDPGTSTSSDHVSSHHPESAHNIAGSSYRNGGFTDQGVGSGKSLHISTTILSPLRSPRQSERVGQQLRRHAAQSCRYACLDPVMPLLQDILDPDSACDLLELYFAEPDGSLFETPSPYVLTPVIRKRSLLRSMNPRKTTPALLVTMIWVSAQTADVSVLLRPGTRNSICERLLALILSLMRGRDPDNLNQPPDPFDRYHSGHRRSTSDAADTLLDLRSQTSYRAIDDVITFVLLTIVISGGDLKKNSLQWWGKAVRRSQDLSLNQIDRLSHDAYDDSYASVHVYRSHGSNRSQSLAEVEINEEARRTFWLLYTLDRHLALSYNGNLFISDDQCQVYNPLPDRVWESLESYELPRRTYGPPTRVTGTGYLEYFLPLMAILGDVIQTHHRRNHPRFGTLAHDDSIALIEDLIEKCTQSVHELSSRGGPRDADMRDVGLSQSPVSPMAGHVGPPSSNYPPLPSPSLVAPYAGGANTRQRKVLLVSLYSRFILHVIQVLLHGKWDALSMLSQQSSSGSSEGADDPMDISNWITSVSFMKCASNAIMGSEVVSDILRADPELTFMPYLFGIYLLHGSFILLLFADRMPDVGGGPNESVEKACETIIRAHEVCVVTLSTEFQRRFRKVLRATIYRVRSQKASDAHPAPTVASLLSHPADRDGPATTHPTAESGLHASDMDMRKKVLSLYRWTSGSRGLAV